MLAVALSRVVEDAAIGGDVDVERLIVLGHALPHVLDLRIRRARRRGVETSPTRKRPLLAIEIQIDRAARAGQALQRHDAVLVVGNRDVDRVRLRRILRLGGRRAREVRRLQIQAHDLIEPVRDEHRRAARARGIDAKRDVVFVKAHAPHERSRHARHGLSLEKIKAALRQREPPLHEQHALRIAPQQLDRASRRASIRQHERRARSRGVEDRAGKIGRERHRDRLSTGHERRIRRRRHAPSPRPPHDRGCGTRDDLHRRHRRRRRRAGCGRDCRRNFLHFVRADHIRRRACRLLFDEKPETQREQDQEAKDGGMPFVHGAWE